MKKCFTQCTLEISKREIELLAGLYEYLKEEQAMVLRQAEELARQGLAHRFPRGYELSCQMDVLRQFKWLRDTGDVEMPFDE